ncbi:MAG TPA: FliG C-terminal domain-containing protein [Armatimonadota bacterium]|jgi:flagellar motor switch protein FliG
MTQDRLTNTQRVAAFLLTLDAERSAKVIEHLDPGEIAKIGQEIAAMGKLSQQTKRTVIREFRALLGAEAHRAASMSLAHQVLGKAMNEEQAQAILRQVTPTRAPAGPPFLCSVTPGRAAELLASEPIYLMVLLLASLPNENAQAIIACLPADVQSSVRTQLAGATRPAPEVRAALERAVRSKATFLEHEEQVDGQAALEEIFKEDAQLAAHLTQEKADSLSLSSAKRPVASPTPQGSLSFTGLRDVKQNVLQDIFRRAPLPAVIRALSGLDAADRDQLLARLPLNRRVVILNRLRGQTPLTLRAITDAQEEILRIARDVLAPRQSGRTRVKEPSHA